MLIEWHIPMVMLSVLLAMIGSLAALAHAQRMRMSTGRAAQIWMFVGAATLGTAIWSMHFIGMIALHLQIPVGYDLPLTLLSLLPAIAAALLAFSILRQPIITTRHIILSSALMGAGISAMHYTGMEALRMFPPFSYNPLSIAASLLVAFVASLGAMLMLYRGEQIKMLPLPRFILGGAIMGLAISGMHYTSLVGVQFVPGSVCLSYASGIGQDIPAMMVSLFALLWFGGGIIAALYDQHMARQSAEALMQLEKAHSELQARSNELAEHAELLRSITGAAQDAVMLLDVTGRVTYWNPAAEHMFGYTESEIIGQELHELIVPERYLASSREGFSRFVRMGTGPLIGKTRQLQAKRKSGIEFPVEISLSAVKLSGQWSAVGIVRDATEHVQSEQRLKQLATTDTLTGIYNRRHFNEVLINEINRCARFPSPLSLILLDVDHFKRINDAFGHQTGDQTLIQLALTIGSAMRTTDLFARWGGEEFVVLVPGCDLDASRLLAEKLRMLIEQQHFTDVGQVTCSFGVAQHVPGEDIDELMKKADRCLYYAKAAGRNRVETSVTTPADDLP